MARRDDDFPLLLAAGVLGIGAPWMAASAYQSNEERRKAFVGRLAEALSARELQLVSASFGRGPQNRPFWNVTLHTLWDGVRTIKIDLLPGTEPYAPDTCDVVAREVALAA